MVTVLDVDANKLIETIAESLKKTKEVKAPEWAAFVKTAHYKDKVPYNEDWWFMRAAAILRRVYLEPMGVSRLKKAYGGKKNRGYKPEKFFCASGNIIRKILQQLEAAKYVQKDKKGRAITPLGQKFLNKTASDIFVAPKKTVAKTEAVKKEATKVVKEAVKEDVKTEAKEETKTEAPKPKTEDKKEAKVEAPKAEETKEVSKK